MSIPLFGLIFIPVALWVFVARTQYLLPLLVISSIFEGASVLNLSLGAFPVGVQPYFFVAILVAIKAYFSRAVISNRLRFVSPAVKGILFALAGLWAWAVAGAFVFPFIFSGIEVINPRSALGQTGLNVITGLYAQLTPLVWGFRNLGQCAYLTLNVVAVVFAAAMGLKVEYSRRAVNALRAAVVIAALVVLAQGITSLLKWDFPYSFFNSNPTYAQLYTQTIAGLRRANSTFTEPSYAGGFLGAATLGLIAASLYSLRRRALSASTAAVGCILTTASTGFLTLAVGGVLVAIKGVTRRLRSRGEHLSLNTRRGALGLLLLTFTAVGTLLVFSPRLRLAIFDMTSGKLASASALGRVSAALYSLGLTFRTWGFGLGLGSNRPADELTYISSNLGVVGIILFGLFLVRLFRQLFRVSRDEGGGNVTMVCWMLLGLVIAQIPAIPDLNWPAIWAVMAVGVSLLVSCQAPVSIERIRRKLGDRLPSTNECAGVECEDRT